MVRLLSPLLSLPVCLPLHLTEYNHTERLSCTQPEHRGGGRDNCEVIVLGKTILTHTHTQTIHLRERDKWKIMC